MKYIIILDPGFWYNSVVQDSQGTFISFNSFKEAKDEAERLTTNSLNYTYEIYALAQNR